MKKLLFYILPLMVNGLIGQNLPQKIDTNNQIIVHNGYIISYNEGCEQPNWVYYVLKPSDVAEKTAIRKNYFKKDNLIPTGSAVSTDYTKTGYDRGHLKPAGDESNDQAQMDETFYMSNISPQSQGFNRGIWKRLETYTRDLVVSYDSIIVITGGLLDDRLRRIGKNNNVCIPTNYFKILYLYRGGLLRGVEGYLMPNTPSKGPLEMYLTPVKFIEGKANLKFL